MYVSVKKVAQFLGVSQRRVRVLLSQGRIRGFKDKPLVMTPEASRVARWYVDWPLDVRPGTRGPDLHKFPIRDVLFELPKPSKVVRQGVGMPYPRKNASKGLKIVSA